MKTYLGDAVYLETGQTRGSIILTTEDGYRSTNTICLEQEVIESLLSALEKQGWISEALKETKNEQ